MELRHVIQEALLKCEVHHDDLEFMSQAVEEEILKHYILTPREDYSSLAERLEQLQEAILKGEEPGELLEQAITEAEETQYFEGLTFKEPRPGEMRRKANYLRELTQEPV